MLGVSLPLALMINTYDTRKEKLSQRGKGNVRRGAKLGIEGSLESIEEDSSIMFRTGNHSHKVRRQLSARREPYMIHGRKAKAKMKPR